MELGPVWTECLKWAGREGLLSCRVWLVSGALFPLPAGLSLSTREPLLREVPPVPPDRGPGVSWPCLPIQHCGP